MKVGTITRMIKRTVTMTMTGTMANDKGMDIYKKDDSYNDDDRDSGK